MDPGPLPVLDDTLNVFLGVVDEGKDGTHPDNGGNPIIPHDLQHLGPAAGGAYMGFNYPALVFIAGGQGHLYHAPCLLVDSLKQVQIPQNQV